MHDLPTLLPHGVGSRVDLTLATSASSVARWTADGQLVHLHPGVVMLPSALDDPRARARAASLWARGPLSHLTALAVWESVPSFPEVVHVTVPADRFPRGSSGVMAHRTTRPLPVTTVDGLQVVHLNRSLVDAWSCAHSARRNPHAAAEIPLVRQAVIEAVRDRGVSLAGIRAESAAQSVHGGRVQLGGLLDLLADGCESELEIWGVTHVLPGPPALPRWDAAVPHSGGRRPLGRGGRRLPRRARHRRTRRRRVPRQPESARERPPPGQCPGHAGLGGAPVQLRPPGRRPGGLPAEIEAVIRLRLAHR